VSLSNWIGIVYVVKGIEGWEFKCSNIAI
jgi:hypothetical protein